MERSNTVVIAVSVSICERLNCRLGRSLRHNKCLNF
jgi:hypothetical protein